MPIKKDKTLQSQKIALVKFYFYSSYHTNVMLAKSPFTNKNDLIVMKKTNNYFYSDILITNKLQYYFIADSQATIDPFANKMFSQYMEFQLLSGFSTSNIQQKLFISDHFEYFSRFGNDKSGELESYFIKLTNFLNPLSPKLKKPKIRYYTPQFVSFPINLFTIYETSEIFDSWDCASSHEIIHTLVHIKNYPLNEGLAQCFQKEGNLIYKEQNVNLVSQKYIKEVLQGKAKTKISIYELISDQKKFLTINATLRNSYHMVGSFIFYNWYVLNDADKFSKFLLNLKTNDNGTTITNKYTLYTGKNFISVETQWTNWLMTINLKSSIYIQWK
jgi:hypothetical protein